MICTGRIAPAFDGREYRLANRSVLYLVSISGLKFFSFSDSPNHVNRRSYRWSARLNSTKRVSVYRSPDEGRKRLGMRCCRPLRRYDSSCDQIRASSCPRHVRFICEFIVSSSCLFARGNTERACRKSGDTSRSSGSIFISCEDAISR